MVSSKNLRFRGAKGRIRARGYFQAKQDMIKKITKIANEDKHLSHLLDNVTEYAEVYYFAKARQKGCDGMGEVATLKDEFISVLDEMVDYCKEKGFLTEDFCYDLDKITSELITFFQKAP